jgi:hypothetical protein
MSSTKARPTRSIRASISFEPTGHRLVGIQVFRRSGLIAPAMIGIPVIRRANYQLLGYPDASMAEALNLVSDPRISAPYRRVSLWTKSRCVSCLTKSFEPLTLAPIAVKPGGTI